MLSKFQNKISAFIRFIQFQPNLMVNFWWKMACHEDAQLNSRHYPKTSGWEYDRWSMVAGVVQDRDHCTAILKIGLYLWNRCLKRVKISSILTPWFRKGPNVQLLELWPMAKFHAQIWQSWKSARISETGARRAKISPISTPWGRKSVYVQLLELWQMAKLGLKQSVKAHGPLVIQTVHFILQHETPLSVFGIYHRKKWFNLKICLTI